MLPPSWPSCFTVGMVFKLYQYSRSFPVILSKALKVLTHSYSTFNNKLMLYLLRALIAVLCLSFRLYIMFGIHIFPIFYFNLFVKSLKKMSSSVVRILTDNWLWSNAAGTTPFIWTDSLLDWENLGYLIKFIASFMWLHILIADVRVCK